jgi:hypothetical protein
MTYFITKFSIACSEEPEEADSLDFPILGIVVMICSGVKEK